MKQIKYYKTKTGKCPYIEWVETLRFEYQLKILKRVNRMREGLYGDCKRLTGSKLSELRFQVGPGYRVYFKELDNVIILVLAGSDKANQNATIKKADKYLQEYLERNNNEKL